MADLFAIISKAQFEAAHPKARVGDTLGFSKYVSTHAALTPVRDGGSLFLVTVRPPDERLWLVGELTNPRHDGKAWNSAPSTLAVKDITPLITQLKFVTGKGISAKKGALGMSLQTPRQLTAEDVALLRGGEMVKPYVAEPVPVPKVMEVAPLPAPLPAVEGRGSSSLSLGAVLDEWRATRAPELEQLIDTLSKHHARAYPPLDPEADDYDAQWTQRANEATAEGLAPLLPGLWSDPRGSIPMRLRKLLDLGPDPRLGEALLTMIDEPPFTASSQFSAWTLLFKHLPSMVDTRAAKRLQARAGKKGGASQFWPKLTGWIEGALAQLPEPVKLSKEQLASVAKRQKEAEALLKGPPPASAVKEKTSAVLPMTGSPRETLEAAVAHARAGRFLGALEPLRQYWVVTRASAAAALLSQLPKLNRDEQPDFDQGKPAEVHARWMKAARTYDATLVTPLLDAIIAGTLSDAEERLEVMLGWPPDPRVTECMLERIIFGRQPYIGARPQLFKRAYDLMVISADPRHRQRVEENAARLERAAQFDRNRAERPHASRTLVPYVTASASGRAPSPDEQQLLTELEGLVKGVRSRSKASSKAEDELALILTINAAGDDHTPRAVYADFLAERGDPRAEFINLSLAFARGEKVKGKLEAWEKANARALKGAVTSASFTHHLGLPITGALARYGGVQGDLEAACDDLRWASVRVLTLLDVPQQVPFLQRAQLHGVKALHHAMGEQVRAAAERDFPWAIEHLSLDDYEVAGVPAAFPKLESISFPLWGQVNEAAFTSPLVQSVKRIVMGDDRTYGTAPIDLLIKHAGPKLEAIDITTSAFCFKAVPKNGKLDLTFELGGQPNTRDEYFMKTMEALERVPAGAIDSFTFKVMAGKTARPDALARAEQASQHLPKRG